MLHQLIKDAVIWQFPLGLVLLCEISHQLRDAQVSDPTDDEVQQNDSPLRVRHDDRPSPHGDRLELVDKGTQFLVKVSECQIEVVGMRDDLTSQDVGTGKGAGCPWEEVSTVFNIQSIASDELTHSCNL